MCTLVLTPNGEHLGCIADLVDAGFVVTEEDRTSPPGSCTTSDGNFYEWPEHRADDDECLCNVDIDAIVGRSGRPHVTDEVWGDIVLTA